MIYRIVLRSRVAISIAITLVLLSSLLVPPRAIASHFNMIRNVVRQYIPESEYYISFSNGEVEVRAYYGLINGHSVICLETNNVTKLLMLFDVHIARDAAVVGIDVAKFISNQQLVMRGLRGSIKIRIYEPVEFIGGVFRNYVIVRLGSVSTNATPDLVYYLSKKNGDYPVSTAQLFISDLSEAYSELIDIWSIPIYALIFVSTLVNAIRLSRSLIFDIRKLVVLGAKRIRIFGELFYAIVLLISASTLTGLSIGYVFTQIGARFMWWFSGVQIIPIINVAPFLKMLTLSMLFSLAGAVFPLYVYTHRVKEVDQV